MSYEFQMFLMEEQVCQRCSKHILRVADEEGSRPKVWHFKPDFVSACCGDQVQSKTGWRSVPPGLLMVWNEQPV
jgi:hypothetical protein